MERRIAEIKEKSGAWLNGRLLSIPLGELTLEKLLEIEVDYNKMLSDDLGVNAGDPITEGQQIINNLKTRLENGSENALTKSRIKFLNEGFVTEEDGRGITDPEDQKEFNKMLDASQKLMSEEEIETRVNSLVLDWDKETYTTDELKPADYNDSIGRLKRLAKQAYQRTRRQILIRNPNIDDEDLHTQTTDAIVPKFKDFFDGNIEPKTDAASAIAFTRAIGENSRLIDLTVPFNDGERRALVENQKNISLKLPINLDYWRTNNKIKDADGTPLSTYGVFRRRMIATGFIEEDTLEPAPERALVKKEVLPLIFKNPSMANLLQAISASEDPEWAIQILNEPGLDSNALYGHTLQQNMEEHKYGSIDMDWMEIGVIDEDLINQYKEIVPDFNPWSSPQNMLPAIATEQVNAKLGQTEPGEIDWNKLSRAADKVVGGLTFRDVRPLEEVEESMDETYSQFNKIVTDVVRTVGDVALTDPFDWINDIDRDMLDNLLRSIPTGHDLRPLAEQIEASDKSSQEGKILIANLINNLSTMIVGAEQ